MSSSTESAQRLPDIPRWVELRDYLLSEECEIFSDRGNTELAFVLYAEEDDVLYVVGMPAVEVIDKALLKLGAEGSLIVAAEHSAYIRQHYPHWAVQQIYVYELSELELSKLPQAPDTPIEFVDMRRLEQGVSDPELREELLEVAEDKSIAALFVNREPVSFCYVASETETWWDVSIDTLPAFRRKGYAGLCFAHMARHMHAQGKRPVWQSLESNPASWALAIKLGFKQVDELVIFEGVTA